MLFLADSGGGGTVYPPPPPEDPGVGDVIVADTLVGTGELLLDDEVIVPWIDLFSIRLAALPSFSGDVNVCNITACFYCDMTLKSR